ncbi:MAG: hypothetical protein JJV97_04685 [SAR324 cluster bacterium]|nr:hypothetical protein [SAR324 cluster bacterium]
MYKIYISFLALCVSLIISSCTEKPEPFDISQIPQSSEIVEELKITAYPGKFTLRQWDMINQSLPILAYSINDLARELPNSPLQKRLLLTSNIKILKLHISQLQQKETYLPSFLSDNINLDYLLNKPIYSSHEHNIDIYLNLSANHKLRASLITQLSDYLTENPDQLESNYSLNNLLYLKSSVFPDFIDALAIKPNSKIINSGPLSISMRSTVSGSMIDIFLLINNISESNFFADLDHPMVTSKTSQSQTTSQNKGTQLIKIPAKNLQVLHYKFELAQASYSNILNFSFTLNGKVYLLKIK